MSIILFLVILVALIVVHEFGHFLTAKAGGIRVDEFGIGFPPRLFGVRKGETMYSVNALPLGGFVKIFGEDPDTASISGPGSTRSFVNKPKTLQAAVLVAGVAGNILLAWVLLTLGFVVGMPTSVDSMNNRPLENIRLVASGVLPGSPAETVGIERGDTIVRLAAGTDTIEPRAPKDVFPFVAAHEGPIMVEVMRSKKIESLTVYAKKGVIAAEPETPAIGIALGEIGDLRLPFYLAPIEGAKATAHLLTATAVGLYQFVGSALVGAGDLSQVTGPVGIVGLVGDASALGFMYLLSFTALISINLAIINLLPFPSLDGGRLLFVIIEAIKGSAIRPAVANTLNTVGFVFLILLMIFVTYHDIVKLATS